jgi:hypothetical protein
MKYWMAIFLAVLSFRADAAGLGEAIPELPDLQGVPSTLKTPPIVEVTLGGLILSFENTTLDDVRRLAGAGEILHRGDAGASEYQLCYKTLLDKKTARIYLLSGELGGSEHSLGSFYAELDGGDTKGLIDCPSLPEKLKPLLLNHLPFLGGAADQLERLWGEPSAKRGDWLLYSYSGRLDNNFDRMMVLGVRVQKGRIVGFYFSQATTN